MLVRGLAAAAAVGLLIGGCTGTSGDAVTSLDVPTAFERAMAAPIDGGREPLTVRGYVVGDLSSDPPTLTAAVCESVSRSDPPACEGRRLRIANVPDVSSLQARVGALRQTRSRCWSNAPLELSGTVHREGAEVVLEPA